MSKRCGAQFCATDSSDEIKIDSISRDETPPLVGLCTAEVLPFESFLNGWVRKKAETLHRLGAVPCVSDFATLQITVDLRV